MLKRLLIGSWIERKRCKWRAELKSLSIFLATELVNESFRLDYSALYEDIVNLRDVRLNCINAYDQT